MPPVGTLQVHLQVHSPTHGHTFSLILLPWDTCEKVPQANTSAQTVPPTAHSHSYTYCPNSRKHAQSPTRPAHPAGPQSAGPGGLLTARERAGDPCAARPAVAGRSWGSRGRASRGAARCPAPPPRAAPARPLPGGRRPFHDSAPPAKPPSRVSHRCLESPPGREAILVPPAVETSPSGRRGALKWGRGQA